MLTLSRVTSIEPRVFLKAVIVSLVVSKLVFSSWELARELMELPAPEIDFIRPSRSILESLSRAISASSCTCSKLVGTVGISRYGEVPGSRLRASGALGYTSRSTYSSPVSKLSTLQSVRAGPA